MILKSFTEKASQKAFVRPSFPGDLVISILFNSCSTSSSVISFPQRAHHLSILECVYLIDIAIPFV